MGTTTVRAENRACATCRLWKGARSVEKLGSVRVVRVDTSRQPCGKSAGAMSTPGACCGSWDKWGRL